MGKAKGLIARISGAEKPKEELPKNKEEHDVQFNAGLTAIDTEEQKYLENKEISRENAVKVADSIKRSYPVFKSITVVDSGKTWDYDYVASPHRIKRSKYGKLVSQWQVHHVIPKRFKGHALFSRINFDLENIINKVELPSDTGLHPTASIHRGRHFAEYGDEIHDELDRILIRLNQGIINQKNAKFEVFRLIN